MHKAQKVVQQIYFQAKKFYNPIEIVEFLEGKKVAKKNLYQNQYNFAKKQKFCTKNTQLKLFLNCSKQTSLFFYLAQSSSFLQIVKKCFK